MAISGKKVLIEMDKPVKDHGADGSWNIDSTDQKQQWKEQQAMYINLRYPDDHSKKRKRRKRIRQKAHEASKSNNADNRPCETGTPPSVRVATILGRDEEDEEEKTHEIFCEMDELRMVGDDGEQEWKETARWIKFEEDVEEGGDRWSKPHVATLSLHSLFELRKGLMSGVVLLDMDASSIPQITEILMDTAMASGQLTGEQREKLSEVMLIRHRHQHEKKEGIGLPVIRSLADIGRKMSSKNLEKKESQTGMNKEKQLGDALAGHHSISTHASSTISYPNFPHTISSPKKLGSSSDLLSEEASNNSNHKFNQHFFKKIPAGAEAANILVGEVDFLTNSFVAFVRLQKASILGDITEVAVPTRFIFYLLGPQGYQKKYHEIGRSIATLMSDEIFHDVAYKANDRKDLLAGIDEFLDCVTVLPPGEWDPTIRIEPPKSVPSQENRKKLPPSQGELPNGGTVCEGEPEGHGDSTLKRTGRLFGGLINDIKRKAPWYASDFKDSLHPQIVAAFFFMYFASLTPIITFGGLLGAATNDNMAAMESLVSGAICGITYHLFAGQPLTILGSTGPVLVFETIVFAFCTDRGWNYLEFRFWIGAWMCFGLLIIVAFDLSSLVRYITRFTEESFAMLIAIIFIFEAFKKQYESIHTFPVNFHPELPLDYNCTCLPPHLAPNNSIANYTTPSYSHLSMEQGTRENNQTFFWTDISPEECEKLDGVKMGSGCGTPVYIPNVFFFSNHIFVGTFALSMALKSFRNTTFLPNKIRVLISDFAVFLAIVIMTLIDFLFGLKTSKLAVPENLSPTRSDRTWVVNPFSGRNPWYCCFAGIPPALFATILIFMDQQITAVIINRKEHKLRKGSGYHLDLLLITLQIGVCTVLGTPWFVAATVLSINHVRSLTRESETSAPGERPKFLGVREQRVTGVLVFIMVGLSAFMAKILKLLPMSVLYGVFLYMGISSLTGIQFVQRMMVLLMPAKYQPDYMFLRHVPIARVHLFTFIQFLCLAGLCIIKEIKKISIIFPLMVLAMCFIRKSLDWVFTQHELKWLDDIMPEANKREKEDKKKELMLHEDEELGGGNGDAKEIVAPMNKTASEVSHNINISEEMDKTSIWKNISYSDTSELHTQQPPPPTYNSRHRGRDKKEGPVKFKISEEDDDEEKDHLIQPCPQILIESPSNSNVGKTDQATPSTKL